MTMPTPNVHSTRSFGLRTLGLLAMLPLIWVILIGASVMVPRATPYRIGVLISRAPYQQTLEGLREGLAQLGYHEGKEVAFIIEDAQGEVANMDKRAARLVQATPDLLFTITTGPTIAARQATATIPIVFAVVADPIGSDLITTYATSQNNLTGITNYAGPLSGKRLEILRDIAPGIKRVLALVAPQELVATVSFQFLAEAAPKLGIELVRRDVTSKEEIALTLEAIPRDAVDAIYFVPSILVGTHIALLIDKAMEAKIPLAVIEQPMVEQGALMSFGADTRLLGLQAAKLVAKVLQGAKPSELPIQTPERLPLALNLATARAIGLDIPANILERIDRFVD